MVQQDTASALEIVGRIEDQLNSVILGQEHLIRSLLVGLFAKIPYSFRQGDRETAGCGHILLEGVPGLAKTLSVMALSKSINASFQRIQFTPDLLPSDILGTRIFDGNTNTFRTEKGPIFAHIVLADEINRATPKTQSALLEAMQERQVTIGEETFHLQSPFWVLATQNPLEQEGVYVLPEAQVDRFAMKIVVGYPPREREREILSVSLSEIVVEPVIVPEEILQVRDTIGEVHVSVRIQDYIVSLLRATRSGEGLTPPHVQDLILSGVSPRAGQHVIALARVVAFLAGRDYVLPEDIKHLAVEALQHRIVRTVHAEAERISGGDIVKELLAYVPIP